MLTTDTVKKTLLDGLKKVQNDEQLNVSDALLEKIAMQLFEDLRKKAHEVKGFEDEDFSEFFDLS